MKRSAETPNKHRIKRTSLQSKVIFENQFDSQLLKEMAVFHLTTKLITILTTAGQLSLSWKRKPQTPFKFSYFLRPILILYFHPRLFFKVGLLLQTPPHKKFSSSPDMHILASTHKRWYNERNVTEEANRFTPPSYFLAIKHFDINLTHNDISLTHKRKCSNFKRSFN